MASQEYKNWIDNQKGNFPYYTPTPAEGTESEQIPIVASDIRYDFHSGDTVTDTEMREAKDCNFNVVMINSVSSGCIGSNLDVAAAQKMKLMFLSENMEHPAQGGILGCIYFKAQTEEQKKQRLTAYGGYRLQDEPTYKEIIGAELQARYKDLMEQGVKKLVYINLIGAPVANWMPNLSGYTDTQKYEAYVDAYQQNFKPAFFCYDLYPIREDTNLLYLGILPEDKKIQEGHIELKWEKEHFYNDLEFFHKESKTHGRPFWAFCQGMAFLRLNERLFRPAALEQYLRYEAFSALAYGARGIVYWSYASNSNGVENDTTIESHLVALLDRKGRKTAAWYAAQRVNAEIQSFRDIFLNGEVQSVKRVKVTSVRLKPYDITFSCEKEEGMIASYINMGSYQYIILVNTDVINYQTITILNNSSEDVIEVTSRNSTSSPNEALGIGTALRILIPGGYRIFKISI